MSTISTPIRPSRIDLSRGCIGRELFLLDRKMHNVVNRPIELNRVAMMRPDIDKLANYGPLQLVRRHSGGFWIAAGQHRATTIHLHGSTGRKYEFYANIWTAELMEEQDTTLREIVERDNAGARHSVGDKFFTLSPSSPWVRAAERAGIEISCSLRGAGKQMMNWPEVLPARQIASRCIKNRKFAYDRRVGSSNDRIGVNSFESFLDFPSEDITETLAALGIWRAALSRGANLGIRTMNHRMVLAAWLCVYHENRGHKHLEGSIERLFDSDHVRDLARIYKNQPFRDVYEPLIFGLNHRLRERDGIKCFGVCKPT